MTIAISTTQIQITIDTRAMATELRIDIPGMTDWVSLLRPNPDVNMCRIPAELVEANDNGDQDYAPKYISIGPYHYGKEELRSMQKVKLQYLNDLLARNKSNTIERFGGTRPKVQSLRSGNQLLAQWREEYRRCI
ncbi:hypothetical protein ZOSMA_563G00050 [Zostera marina]|uniref:Uncharacterized protein n=1 Tax=Zostera marina TaxID=29655 RepID=A0A0K9NWC2_ZOSMR|nr:hypothetical protein ZOSMA_563G00050 [Zostera marina]